LTEKISPALKILYKVFTLQKLLGMALGRVSSKGGQSGTSVFSSIQLEVFSNPPLVIMRKSSTMP